MKSLIRNIAFIAVIVLYIISTMGYGVHRCVSDGTASLILLFGESPCEYVHSHVDEHGNTCTHSHAPGLHGGECGHDGEDGHHKDECDGHHGEEHDGCCSTDVYVLTQDQKTVEDNTLILPQVSLISAVIQNITVLEAPSAGSACPHAQLLQVLHHKEGCQAVLCTFRI